MYLTAAHCITSTFIYHYYGAQTHQNQGSLEIEVPRKGGKSPFFLEVLKENAHAFY